MRLLEPIAVLEMPTDAEEHAALLRLGQLIRVARKQRRLSQGALAQLAHMSPTVVNRVERGRQSITAFRLARLAQILDLSMDDLVGLDIPTREN